MPVSDRQKAVYFQRHLLSWYAGHERPMPWKNERNPYYIWLSEIILQQTRVEQGMPYYLRFRERYPTVGDLADAPEDEVLKLWEGLGYYTRARNLHKAARQIAYDRNGIFPDTYEEILSLPGVGPYTAAAIASFGFGLAYPVLDGNVFRILSRYFGLYTPIDAANARQVFTAVASQVLDQNQPGIFNQAIMDFGASVCIPASPLCHSCPLATECHAFKEQKVAALPVKTKKIAHKERFFHYLVCTQGESSYIRQRTAKDIWRQLYEFPMIEAEKVLDVAEIRKTDDWQNWFGQENPALQQIIGPFHQTLTHRKITAYFYQIQLSEHWQMPDGAEWRKMAHQNFGNYAFPKIITFFLSNKDLPLNLF